MNDRLDRRLNELWDRVTGGGAPAVGGARPLEPGRPAEGPAVMDMVTAERDLLKDTLAQLRRRFSQEKDAWERLLEERNRGMEALRGEKKRLEAELARVQREWNDLRSDVERQLEFQTLEKSEREADLTNQILRHRSELKLYERQLQDVEAAHREELARYEKSLAGAREEGVKLYQMLEDRDAEIASLKARLSEEETQKKKALSEAVDGAAHQEGRLEEERKKIAAERVRWDEEREAQRSELQNIQKLLESAQEEIAGRSRAQADLEARLQQSDEGAGRLQAEVKSLREAWELERGHWRELWEKERSSREGWTFDMRDWEERLRREREEWLKSFQAEEEARARATKATEHTLREIHEAVTVLKTPPPASGEARSVSGRPAPAPEPLRTPRPLAPSWNIPRPAFPPALLPAAGAAVVLLVAAMTALSFLKPAKFLCPLEHSSGFDVRGDDLWYTDWMNGQVVQAAAKRPDKILFYGSFTSEMHPVALRWAEGRLWSLDAWSKSLREHQLSPPFAVASSWPLEGASPVDFAWDGQGFWVLDRDEQVLRRLASGRLDAVDKKVVLPYGWRLAALHYRGGEFWGYDASSLRLKRFVVSPRVHVTAEARLAAHERPESPLTAFSVTDGNLWTLSEKSRSVYRWPRLALAARFLMD